MRLPPGRVAPGAQDHLDPIRCSTQAPEVQVERKRKRPALQSHVLPRAQPRATTQHRASDGLDLFGSFRNSAGEIELSQAKAKQVKKARPTQHSLLDLPRSSTSVRTPRPFSSVDISHFAPAPRKPAIAPVKSQPAVQQYHEIPSGSGTQPTQADQRPHWGSAIHGYSGASQETPLPAVLSARHHYGCNGWLWCARCIWQAFHHSARVQRRTEAARVRSGRRGSSTRRNRRSSIISSRKAGRGYVLGAWNSCHFELRRASSGAPLLLVSWV